MLKATSASKDNQAVFILIFCSELIILGIRLSEVVVYSTRNNGYNVSSCNECVSQLLLILSITTLYTKCFHISNCIKIYSDVGLTQ
jgi:hypothetical protein